MSSLLLTCFLFVCSFGVIYTGFKYLANICDLIVETRMSNRIEMSCVKIFVISCSKTGDTFGSVKERKRLLSLCVEMSRRYLPRRWGGVGGCREEERH